MGMYEQNLELMRLAKELLSAMRAITVPTYKLIDQLESAADTIKMEAVEEKEEMMKKPPVRKIVYDSKPGIRTDVPIPDDKPKGRACGKCGKITDPPHNARTCES